jgi:hypothetical protein
MSENLLYNFSWLQFFHQKTIEKIVIISVQRFSSKMGQIKSDQIDPNFKLEISVIQAVLCLHGSLTTRFSK